MTSIFALPDRLRAKSDPDLLAGDEAHFARIARSLNHQRAGLQTRIDEARRRSGHDGQEAMDRDLEVHRLTTRLRALNRYSLDLCLGRFVMTSGETTYVGRVGLMDEANDPILVDWRSPAAEPFFAATHQDPRGLASRRRYRWTGGRITDYWDEVYTDAGFENRAVLDDQSAFIASLGVSRSPRMRDVLATIAADQDAIIRAPSRGALVVDGGPGTGKTVVALHRAAYLIYADSRLRERSGGVLFVGPHQPYLAYVADVLPSLGEEDVRTCTLRDLVPGADSYPTEGNAVVARLKADARMVAAIEPAVALYEEMPSDGTNISTQDGTVWLAPGDWQEALASVEPGTPHNVARDEVWSCLIGILADKLQRQGEPHTDNRFESILEEDEFDAYGLRPDEDDDPRRRSLETNEDLVDIFGRVWPRLAAEDIVGDLWEVPAYLRRCAPWLAPDEVALLQRTPADAWTAADLPLLDAARRRLGDPNASRRRRQRLAEARAERRARADVATHLMTSDDSDLQIMSMLRGQDMRSRLEDETASTTPTDPYAGPFAHIVVDEAQELTDAQWQMLLSRCPSRSMTIVGDRAQAREGFNESWSERLERVGIDNATVRTLTVNYRTPAEIMAEAEPLIKEAMPTATVPTSIRSSGIPVTHGPISQLERILADWLLAYDEGVACVISTTLAAEEIGDRVRRLRPEHAKGLEFDLVILVDPSTFGEGINGAVDRYVSMTRATQQLVILTEPSVKPAVKAGPRSGPRR